MRRCLENTIRLRCGKLSLLREVEEFATLLERRERNIKEFQRCIKI